MFERQSPRVPRRTLRAAWAVLSARRKRAWIRMWVFGFVGSLIVFAQIPKPLLFGAAVFVGWSLLVAAVSAWGVWVGAVPAGE